MNADLDAYVRYLRRHGVVFDVVGGVLRCDDHDGELIPDDSPRRAIRVEGWPEVLEHRAPGDGLAADHATEMVLRAVAHAGPWPRGRHVLDAGCGTGVLAAAAALTGARSVTASDVDPRALALAARTAADSGAVVRLVQSPLLPELDPSAPPDLVLANLPHKPVPEGAALPISQAGGPDGDAVHVAVAERAADALKAGAAILFFLHSLPHPRLLSAYENAFRLEIVAWKRRWLQPGEYGSLADVWMRRAEDGVSHVGERDGRRFLTACVWRMTRL